MFVFVMKRYDDDELLSTRACVRASFLRVLVEEKTVVGSGVACVFQKALSAFGYSFMCNGIAAKFLDSLSFERISAKSNSGS